MHMPSVNGKRCTVQDAFEAEIEVLRSKSKKNQKTDREEEVRYFQKCAAVQRRARI